MGSMGTLLWCWGFPCSIHPRWTVFLRRCYFAHTTSKTEMMKLWRVASIFAMQSVTVDYDHHSIYFAYGYHVIVTMNSDLGEVDFLQGMQPFQLFECLCEKSCTCFGYVGGDPHFRETLSWFEVSPPPWVWGLGCLWVQGSGFGRAFSANNPLLSPIWVAVKEVG